jgi:hypothetical protein
MYQHFNLRLIRTFIYIEDIQDFLKRHFSVASFFLPSNKPCHYRGIEVGTGKYLAFYLVSFLNEAQQKRFALYRIIDIKPCLFEP